MTRFAQLLGLVVLTALAPLASAQESLPTMTRIYQPSFPFSPPEAWHHHSSTYAEGIRRGEAVLQRALGERSVLEAQARVIHLQGDSVAMDNYVKKTETALARKMLIEQHKDYQRQRTLERRAQGQEMMESTNFELAMQYRLDEYQLDPQTGSIAWPAHLAGPSYAEYRQRVEERMRILVRYGVRSDRAFRDDLAQACDSFRQELETHYRGTKAAGVEIDKSDYIQLQRFLVGLKYTPELFGDVDPEVLAMN